MNIKNLEKTIKLLSENVKKSQFSMGDYREHGFSLVRSESKSCIIGHATSLEKRNGLKNYRLPDGDIDFEKWSEKFYGIQYGSEIWDYLFSSKWLFSKETNSVEHAIFRMENIIDGYEPRPIDDEIIKILVDENTITKES